MKKPTVITVFMIMKKLSIWLKIVQMKDVLNSKLKFYFDEKNGLKLMKSIRNDFHVSLNRFAREISRGLCAAHAEFGQMSIGRLTATVIEPVKISERVYFETVSIHLNKNVLPI